MIKLQGIQVDVVGSVDYLLAEHALFTVEFEYDNKLLVCHTCAITVKRTIEMLIRRVLGPKEKNLQLRQALLQSKYITVQVKELHTSSLCEILGAKYDLIKSNMTYSPYGHNLLISTSMDKKEKLYAELLMNTLMDEIDKNSKIDTSAFKTARGPRTKEVYAYDKITGIFVKEYDSIQAAHEDTGVCKSNISMCCKGHINTAGDYIWSYEKMQVIDLPEDRRRKAPKTPPTPEELERRRQQFIKDHHQI
jgi:hypothetical protein